MHACVKESKDILSDSTKVQGKKYVNSLLAFGQLSTYTKAFGIKYFGGFTPGAQHFMTRILAEGIYWF
jgi:hypothetical protein